MAKYVRKRAESQRNKRKRWGKTRERVREVLEWASRTESARAWRYSEPPRAEKRSVAVLLCTVSVRIGMSSREGQRQRRGGGRWWWWAELDG